MALRQYANLAYDDEELYDRAKGMPKDYEPPEYPPNMQFFLSLEDLKKTGGDDASPNQTMHFALMGEVTSVFKGREEVRIELEVKEFAGEDGKFFDLAQPCHLCLCLPELEKMDLDCDCERGDCIHLIGMARVEHTTDSEYGSGVMLQVTEMTYEDESEENREGGE